MRNLTLLTDLYELTMTYGYQKCDQADKEAVFDLFFRGNFELSYAVACGLEQAVDYILNLHFSEEDVDYLRSLRLFDEDFLQNINENFRFTGDVYAVPEGTIVYPYEPIMTIKAPIMQAQLVETALLCIINHQTLIATKASKIVQNTTATVMEFGLRRAQGPDAGIYGARAAIISGCSSTSNVLAGKMFNVPVAGTHAHSWVMSFPDEITAFREYAKLFPDACLLLVDTYDTLNSGIPNAIKVFDELSAQGHRPLGIRIDSGDLAYLCNKAREMLDAAGYPDAKICASGDIDENVLIALNAQGAKIDSYGIGTKLITSYSNPSLGGVYKLAAITENGELVPKLKISDTTAKVTNPGLKKVVRFYDNVTGKAIADLIMLKDEPLPNGEPYRIFDPENTWKEKTVVDYHVKELAVDVIKNGKLVYKLPTLKEIAEYHKICIDQMWEQYKRITNPHIYKVDLSQKLYDLKMKLLKKKG
ncbi:MAG: nicotinate phosphoribosyltransferase [Clostridia bacterium]|nr:nicotinate phosphoribosyltransferase [Clostridia bacterium]